MENFLKLLSDFEAKKSATIDVLIAESQAAKEKAANAYVAELQNIDDNFNAAMEKLDAEHKKVIEEHINLSDALLADELSKQSQVEEKPKKKSSKMKYVTHWV